MSSIKNEEYEYLRVSWYSGTIHSLPSFSIIMRFNRYITSIQLLFLSTLFSINEKMYAACNGWFNFGTCEVTLPITCDSKDCLQKWVDETKNAVHGLITDKPLSEYASEVILYLLKFVTLVAVIYVIYAGFQILISAGNDENLKKSKNTIIYVAVWIILMWLAYAIVTWIIGLLHN